MNWASARSTTRIEDEAYCLMGLFNVNMPTIYGEGRQAFHRLQHEIMKQSFDTSLFAWGRCFNADTFNPLEQRDIYKNFNTSSKNHVYLLADSPSNFGKPFGRTLRFVPSATRPMQPYLEWQWRSIPVRVGVTVILKSLNDSRLSRKNPKTVFGGGTARSAVSSCRSSV